MERFVKVKVDASKRDIEESRIVAQDGKGAKDFHLLSPISWGNFKGPGRSGNFWGPGPKTRGGRGPPGPPCCVPHEFDIHCDIRNKYGFA